MVAGMAARDRRNLPPVAHRMGVAFLLAQLGAFAAARYAARIAELDLSPAQTGLLLAIVRGPGRSQQALAAELGTAPTRLVALLDGLAERGLIERRRNPRDRRHHAVHLTETGQALMTQLMAISAAHEGEITAALSDAEHGQLRQLLGRLAQANGLRLGVHPGYRTASGAETGAHETVER
jgi:DNA-binding MarR family transcriptional regulator